MIPLLLLVTGLGALRLASEPYWYDEWWSVYNAGGGHLGPLSLAGVFERVAAEDPFNAPGYFMLLSAWGGAAGWSPFAARALSLGAGVLAVVWTYRLGRDAASARAGFYAAVLMGTSAFFIYYTHEVRNYAFTPLFSALTVWAYVRVTKPNYPAEGYQYRDTPAIYLLFVLGAAGLLYTHYVAALVLVALGVYHLLFARKDRRWWRLVGAMAVSALLFAPWLAAFARAFSTVAGDDFRALFNVTSEGILRELAYSFSNGSVIVLVVFGWYAMRARAIRLLLWVTLFVLVSALALNAVITFIIHVRYFMPLWSLLAVIAGAGAANMAEGRLKPGLLVGLWVVAGAWLTLDPTTFRTPWQLYLPWDRLAEELAPQPDDHLLFLLPDGVNVWIHEPVARYYLHDDPVQLDLIESVPGWTAEQYDALIRERLGGASRVWVAFSPQDRHGIFSERGLRLALDGGYLACEPVVARDAQLDVSLYSQPPEAPPRFLFGDQIGVDVVEDGGVTVWTTLSPETPLYTYSISLRVENGAGETVAQTDFGIPNAPRGCYRTSLHRASGERFAVMVYNWATGERLEGIDRESGVTGEILTSHAD